MDTLRLPCKDLLCRLACTLILVGLSACSNNVSNQGNDRPSYGLNDTGIDWCTENIITPGTWTQPVVCALFQWGANLWGLQQDGYFGRDALAAAGTLNKIGSGMAGFDFTRINLGNNGTTWDCVQDNVTGLMWEIKSTDPTHLRYQDHTYSWYNPDASTNAGNAGSDLGSNCVGVADVTRCNTQSYAEAVNRAKLCGYSDWRLPNIDELQSLVHLGQTTEDPNLLLTFKIDITMFPEGSFSMLTVWSSTPTLQPPNGTGWVIDFSTGEALDANLLSENAVRLVRSSQP